VAAVARKLVESPVSVITPAGPLMLRIEERGVFLTGPAEYVADGIFHYGKMNGND
jgi:diaminopimelate epimerase